MAKKAFNLGDYLKSEAPVSITNTAEQLVRIPVEDIVPDPGNFYSLDGIEELAGNIELIGLQQPLRVRPDGKQFVVVSGHRRLEAIKRIREDNPDAFPLGVPCLVDYGEASEAMRELRLIFANSNTRVMTSAETAKQAERVTELLYQLKEQGVEFPGRMRDHVAEACRISASKLARLNAIRKNLIDVWRLMWDHGELPEGHAYRISQEGKTVQRDLLTRCGPNVPCRLTGADLDKVIEQVKRPAEPETPKEEPAAAFDPGKDHTDAAVDDYLAQRTKEDLEYFKMLQYHAASLIRRLAATSTEWQLGRQRQDGIEELKQQHRHHGTGGMKVDLQGSPKGLELSSAKKRLRIQRTWTDVYDMLCVTALQLAAQAGCEEDDEKEEEPADVSRINTGEAAWQTGTPQRDGRYYCRILFADSPEDGGRVHEQRGEWRDGGWWFFGEPEKYGIKVVGWWPLPDEERWT